MSRVLIIGDDPPSLERFSQCLRGASYDVLCTQIGAEVVTITRMFEPDAAVLDLVMPPTAAIGLLQHLFSRA